MLPMTFFRRNRGFRWGGRRPPDQPARPARERRPQGGFGAAGTRLCPTFRFLTPRAQHLSRRQPTPLCRPATALRPLGRGRGAYGPGPPPPARVTSARARAARPGLRGRDRPGGLTLAELRFRPPAQWSLEEGPTGGEKPLPILTTVSAKHRSHFLPSSDSDMFPT